VPRRNVAFCRSCGRHRSVCGPLSWTRQCLDCGRIKLARNIESLARHSGPEFQRWRAGMAASVGAALLDAKSSDPHTGG